MKTPTLTITELTGDDRAPFDSFKENGGDALRYFRISGRRISGVVSAHLTLTNTGAPRLRSGRRDEEISFPQVRVEDVPGVANPQHHPTAPADQRGRAHRRCVPADRNPHQVRIWPWPKWAGDESTPALSVLAMHLDHALRDGTLRDVRNIIREEVALHDEELARRVGAHLDAAIIGQHVESYGVSWLLAVLMRVAPAVADRAAGALVRDWDSGDSIDEWIYQWRSELAKGGPLTLHGIPDAPIAGWF